MSKHHSTALFRIFIIGLVSLGNPAFAARMTITPMLHAKTTVPVQAKFSLLPKPAPLTPEEKWLSEHYPSLLTSNRLQTLYTSLISGYWVPQTGLFLSFPGTGDSRLIQQSATYDQGIVGVLLLQLGDIERARQIVAFYEKAWGDAGERSGLREDVDGLANFYNGFYSVEGIEKIMHVGPNAWIGLLASRFARRTGDHKALALALHVAHWMIDKVPHQHGAIAMGQMTWNSTPWPKIFSTENNLSTYAFLSDLLKSGALSQDDRELIAAERLRIGNWLVKGAYQPQTKSVLRGFHMYGLDTAGAIDSYTWFISSLRPDFLRSHQIPIDSLIEKATQDFAVQVAGHKGIDCVDQGMADSTYADTVRERYRDKNFLRPASDNHRLIWYEGQGQYIVALEDLARDAVHHAFSSEGRLLHPELLVKANAWLQEAKTYVGEMDQASFKMPYGPAFPLATQGRFYLSGWPAPAGSNDHPSDAVAPLVWRLFAGMGYEPLSDTSLHPGAHWQVEQVTVPAIRNPLTAILYGSSEEMAVQAWDLFEREDRSGAWKQAKATIDLWQDDAKVLQQMKKRNVGTYYSFDKTPEGYQCIHDYWALNDVAGCYFILAKICHEQKKFAEAKTYLTEVLDHLYLGQIWDKRGFFWDPIDTIKEDYADADPDHYADLLEKFPTLPAMPVGLIDQPTGLAPYVAKLPPAHS